MSAPKKNQNAVKGKNPLTDSIRFRCSTEQKDLFKELAKSEKLSLSEWILIKLEKYAK